ncbi:MAG: class I SAM-dependent methyltransferase [Lachnospiraceae bacterium]|nr:class I SAM-dependent methyltransferase [Lachnospiraceae bacterium]
MRAYTDFARVYDTFMDETPYEEWCAFLTGVLREFHIEKNLVLELGCGTGTLTQLLADAGFDMIGVDNSEEMLGIAMEKKEAAGRGEELLYLCQDMREFELYGTVKAVISVCDSLNYLLEEDELLKTFRLVNNYLDPKGIFIFDFNTVYKYEQVIGDTTIAENREECSFIWENYYHKEEQINEYELTIFVHEKEELFRRFAETHYQRGYTLLQMKVLVERAGMTFIRALDADTKGEVRPESERIYVIAMESGKEKQRGKEFPG